MKHLKYLEKYNKKTNVGDYILIDFQNKINVNDGSVDFIENSIGKITHIENDVIHAKYDNVPIKYFNKYFNSSDTLTIHDSWISHISKNKKDLEILLNAKKYNL